MKDRHGSQLMHNKGDHCSGGVSARRLATTRMDTLDELKSTGLKATAPRLKILEIFQNAEQRHMTAEDVYRLLLGEHSDIGLATVYRVLTQFEAAGLVLKHNFEGGQAVYELDRGGHHDHMVDVDSGKIIEFESHEIEELQRKIAEKAGYRLVGHRLELYGVPLDGKSDRQK